MESKVMTLKVLLPFRVFAEIDNVTKVVMETANGSYGLLPNRLDCVAALVPGIFAFETVEDGMRYFAVDKGVLVKAGKELMVSVRNAIGGTDLGKLHQSVEKEFKELDEIETNVRTVMAKLESSFIYSLQKLHKT